MNVYAFKKDNFKQIIAFFTLLTFIFSSPLPTGLYADAAVFINQEDEARIQKSQVLVGATLAALGIGIACLAVGCSNHKHHHRHSSYSGSYYSPYSSNYSYESDHDHSDYSDDRSYDSRDYSDDFSDYSIFDNNIVSSWSDNDSLTFGPELSLPRQKVKHTQDSATKNLLSGVFTSHVTAAGNGSLTAFVQLPDGTTCTLGSLPFSENTSSSLSYGPFSQAGIYTFGISLDEGTILPMQAKICSVNVDVNQSTTQSYDFVVPPHSPAHYEPTVCSYHLNK